MNNPLDDIYKDGLKNRSYEFQESDWLGAKHMLELQERKHRIPIWFWIGVGILSIAGMAHVQYSPIQEANKQEEIIANLVDNSNHKKESITSDIIIEANSNDNVNKIDKNTDKEGSSNDITNSNLGNTKTVNNKTIASTNTSTRNKSQQLEDPTAATNSNNGANTIIDKNSTYPNTPVRQGQVFTNFRNTLRHTSSAPSTIQTENQTTAQIDDQSGRNSNGNAIGEDSREIKLGEIDVNTVLEINTAKYSSALSSLPVLSIFPLQLTIPQVELLDNKLSRISVEDRPIRNVQFGMYLAHTTPSPNWSTGLQLEYPLFNKLYISGGAGINWNSSYNILTDDQDAQQNQNSAAGRILTEDIKIQRLSLEMPISLIYKIRKHEVFGGILLNKPILSERRSESSIRSIIETMDPAGPSMDLADPAIQNPITVNQFSVSTDNPALLKWDSFFTLGYGYAINHRLGLRINGTYRLSKVPTIESTLADVEYNLDIPKYSARVTLLFHF